MRAIVFAAALVFSSIVAAEARAEERLRVAPAACAALPFEYAAFEKLLAVELSESGVTLAPTGASTLFVDVTGCDPSGATPVTLTFSGPPARSRAVALGDVEPAVRPRVLALAAAEFVRSSIATRAPAQAPPSSPPPEAGARAPAPPLSAPVAPAPVVTTPWAAPVAEPGAGARPRMRPFTASMAFALRGFPLDDTLLTGLELRGSIKLVGPLRLRTAVVGFYARDDSDLGTVHLAGGAGAIGLSLGARGDVVGFDVGPRLDVGGLLLEGHAAPGASLLSDDTAAPFVGLGLDAEADFWVSPGFYVMAGIEAGGALAGAEGNVSGVPVIGASGPFFGLRLGLGVAP